MPPSREIQLAKKVSPFQKGETFKRLRCQVTSELLTCKRPPVGGPDSVKKKWRHYKCRPAQKGKNVF